jgi:hypothetical protein
MKALGGNARDLKVVAFKGSADARTSSANYRSDDFLGPAQFRKGFDKGYGEMRAALVDLGLAQIDRPHYGFL